MKTPQKTKNNNPDTGESAYMSSKLEDAGTETFGPSPGPGQ